MISPTNNSPIEVMWDSTVSKRKKGAETILQEKIRLTEILDPAISIKLADRHVFTKTPGDSLINKIRRICRRLGFTHYVVLKVHHTGDEAHQVKYVKVDSQDLSKKLQIDSSQLDKHIQAHSDLDVTELIQQVIKSRAPSPPLPAAQVSSEQIKEIKLPMPPKPVKAEVQAPVQEIIKEPEPKLAQPKRPPPKPPSESELAAKEFQLPAQEVIKKSELPLPSRALPEPPPAAPHRAKEISHEERQARDRSRQAALQSMHNIEMDKRDPEVTLNPLVLLSHAIEEWTESAEQDLSILQGLASDVYGKIWLYSESNPKAWTETVRRSRLDALLDMNQGLQDWIALRETGTYIDDPGLSLGERLQMSEANHRQGVKAENRQLLTTFLNTHTPQQVLMPDTGLLKLQDIGQDDQTTINSLISVFGTNDQNWTKWLLDDAVIAAFAAIKTNVNTQRPDRPLEVANPVKRDELAEGLGRAWAEYKDSGARIGVPVNIDNGHWTMVFIDPTKKTIEWYDSMGNLSADIKARLETFKAKQGLKDFNVENKAVSVQTDGYQCGVWISLSLLRRALDDDFSYQKLPEKPEDRSSYVASFRKQLHNDEMVPLLWNYATESMAQGKQTDSLSSESFLQWLKTR